MLWTSFAFVFTLCIPELISGQDPCPKTGSGFFPDPEQCDKYWECRKGKATPKFCADGLVFNPQSPLYERCQYPFYIDCTDRPYLQEAHPRKHCPRSNGLYKVEDDCSAFWQCTSGLARKIRCQGTLAFNPKTGTCQWPHLVPGCENPDGQPGVIDEADDDDRPTVTTTAKPQPPPSRGRTQSRGRRPQNPEPTAAPAETPKPQTRSSRGQNRNRQPPQAPQAPAAPQAPPRQAAPAPRAPVPPPPEASPALGPLPVPFNPPTNVRRLPTLNSETPAEPSPQSLPLPVPFPPTSGVRRIPNYSQPQRNSDTAPADEAPAEPAPTRSQGPPPRRVAANSLRGATEPTPDAVASDGPAVQPPPVRRVVFRRPVTTTQAAPSDDYSYDDFSN